ncbi:MAG: hypothetical protein NZ521_07190, partial [Flammeovirgaceae bacterium]|nr:hypothetical protein [Flammeovirgaceae bacterium]MDW8287995.1 hypothetical protein [Flammeovirgaceae bacterium]
MKTSYLYLLIFVSFITNAQHYKTHHYTAEKGLPNLLTKCIWKDELGFVWIGSDAGVFRFDGKIFESYFSYVKSPYIKSFQKINEKLVVVHDEGADIITNEVDSVFFTPLIKGSSTITDTTTNYPKNIFQDRLGRIWLNEPQSVVRLEKNGLKRYDFGKKHRTNSFLRSFNFAELNQEILVLTSQQGGVFVYDYHQDRFDTLKNIGKIGNINTIASITENLVWIGSSEGLFELVYDKKHFSIKKIPSPSGISVIRKGYNNEVLVGTWNNGIYWAKIASPPVIIPLKLGENIVVNDIFIEKNGDVWVSTDNGFFHLRTTFFGTVELPYRRNYIQCVTQLGDNYFTSDGAVAYRMSIPENAIATQPLFEELYEEKNGDLLAIAPTPQHIWLGNSSGNVLKWESKNVIKTLNLLHLGGTIYHIVADAETNAWVCQYDLNGILQVKPDMSYKLYNAQQGLKSRVYVIKFLADGNLYAGGEGEVFYKYHKPTDSFETFPLVLGTPEKIFISDFFMDNENQLWIGTNLGLLRWKDGKTQRIDFGEKVAVK